MENNLKRQEEELTDEISSLNKKVRPYCFQRDYLTSSQSKFLEKQFNEAQAQLRDIVRPRLDSANAIDLLTTRKSPVSPCTQVTHVFNKKWRVFAHCNRMSPHPWTPGSNRGGVSPTFKKLACSFRLLDPGNSCDLHNYAGGVYNITCSSLVTSESPPRLLDPPLIHCYKGQYHWPWHLVAETNALKT